MNYSYRNILATFIILLVIIANGCESKSGGGAVVNPINEPMILDSVLAINVHEDRPDGITDVFFSDGDQIYLWVYWINVEDDHTVEVQWFSPEEDVDDEPYWRENKSFISRTGQQITWFFIDKPSSGFEEGEWFVEIYLDDNFERMHIFTVE